MSSLPSQQPDSLWLDTLDPPVTKRSPLSGDLSVDVAIVGGGFSGLWTAYYLLASNPNLNVLVIESEYCGFGASGRNGGCCEGALAGGTEKYAAKSSKSEALDSEVCESNAFRFRTLENLSFSWSFSTLPGGVTDVRRTA